MIQKDQTLAKTLGGIDNEIDAEMIVLDGEKLHGVFAPGFILRSPIDYATTKVGHFTRSPPKVVADELRERTVSNLRGFPSHLLPVMENDKVIGKLHAFDLIEDDTRPISTIELQEPACIEADDRRGKAQEMLREHEVLLVVDNGNPINILTAYDLMKDVQLYSMDRQRGAASGQKTKAFEAERPEMDALPVSNFVSGKQLVTVKGSDSVAEVKAKMQEWNRLYLYVEDTARIVGVKDLL